MNQLRTLYRNSRKNSLYGMKAKRTLHIIMFAVLMMAGIGAMCYASGGEGIGIAIAAAPLMAIVAPDPKNKIDLVEAMRGMTEVSDDQVKFLKAIEKELNKREKETLDAFSTNIREALKTVLGDIPEDDKGNVESIAAQLRKFSESVEKMETRLKRYVSDDFKNNLRASVMGNHAKIAEAIRSKQYIQMEINTRDAVLMTTTNTVTPPTGGYPFGADFRGYNEIRYPNNFIIDIIGGRQVSQVPPAIMERNQDTDEGAATLVAEGELKPMVSFSFKDVVYKSRKIAAHIQYTEELKMNPERLYARILSMFENKVIRAWQDLTLDWVIAQASPYTASAMDGTQVLATTPAALTAMALQATSMNFAPDIAWLNPADLEVAKWVQNADGVYLVPPTDGLGTSLRVYGSNSIPAGSALVGDSSTIKEEHSAFILKIGHINDDLIRNQETAVGEIFQLLYQNEFFEGSWVYEDLATVKTAITKTA